MHEVLILNIPLKDWLTIVAIIIAPLSALFIQSKLDERKVASARRLNIFKTLMATRASVLSLEHIKALNMIDIEFYRSKKYREVRKAWRSYLLVRTSNIPVSNEMQFTMQFAQKCEDTLTELLVKMGDSLGYEFDETHIKQSIYKPKSHADDEGYQAFIKEKLAQFFSGDISLPMNIKSLPVNQEEVQEQKKVRDLAIKFLEKKLSESC